MASGGGDEENKKDTPKAETILREGLLTQDAIRGVAM